MMKHIIFIIFDHLVFRCFIDVYILKLKYDNGKQNLNILKAI